MAEIFDFGFQKYRLKLSGVYNQGGLFAVAGDTARRVEVQLLDAAGRVTDTTGIELSLSTAVGQSSSYVDADLIDASKGLYQVDLTNGLFLKPGKQDFQWTIHKDGKKINSVVSRWHIYKNVSDGGNQSFNFYLNADDLKSMQQDFIDDTVKSEALRANVEERYSDLEADYAQDLSELKQNDAELTTQLDQKAKRDDLVVERARIDSLTTLSEGSTTGDAELIDARVGADGITYSNVGGAIRNQLKTIINTGSNLIDRTKLKNGYSIDGTTGEEVVNDQTNVTDFIEVGHAHYTGNFARWAKYDKDKVFIDSYTNSTIDGNTPPRTLPMSPSVKYIRLAYRVDHAGKEQLNLGSEFLPYEPYGNKLGESVKLNNNSVDSNMTTFIKKSSNLFNGSDCLERTTIDDAGNLIVSMGHGISGFISIKPNMNYSSNFVLKYSFYDKDKNFISYTSVASGINKVITPTNSAYARVTFSIYNSVKNKRINEGTELLDYEDFYIKLTDYKIKGENEKTYKFNPCVVTGTIPDVDLVGVNDVNSPFKGTVNHTTIYNLFDNLMLENQSYITKTQLGETDGIPIYQYNFNPPRPIDTLIKPYPKILIGASIHGAENMAVYALYYFFERLCREWETDNQLEYLRHNINFVVVPLKSPRDFSNGTYINVNGVNINRNFDWDWENADNATRGTAPFSEIESVIQRDFLKSNQDALFNMDLHIRGGGPVTDDKLMWLLQGGNDETEIAITTIEKMTRRWKQKYPNLPSIPFYGYVLTGNTPTTMGSGALWGYSKFVLGIPTVVWEGFYASSTMNVVENKDVVDMNVDYLSEYILNVIKYYQIIY